MSFSRRIIPEHWASGEDLNRDLVGIGILLAAERPRAEPNIEDTLVAASIEGVHGDYRVLSLLVDWIEVHGSRLNVDRLTRVIQSPDTQECRSFWAAVAQWQKHDVRFGKLARLKPKRRHRLIGDQTDYLVARNGEDSRFVGTCLVVPNKTLRHRLDDIESPQALVRHHRAYHYRVLVGPTYRADLLALCEKEPQLSPSELARRTYCSFKTAWDARSDWAVITAKRAA